MKTFNSEPPIENSESSIEAPAEEQGNHEDSQQSNESDWMSRMEQNN